MSTEPLPEDTVPTWYVNLAVRWSTTLDPDTKLLLLVLSDIADNLTAQIPPQREPSTAQLMRETGRKKDTVIDRRNKAEAAGWLRLKRPTRAAMARHEPISYQILVPPGAEPPGIDRPVLGKPAPRRTGPRHGGPGPTGPDSDTGSAVRSGVDGTDPGRSAAAAETPVAGVGRSDPAPSGRGRPERPRGVDGSDPAGSTGPTPSFYVPSDGHDGVEKPPAAAGDPAADRAARLAQAEELEQAFWAKYGSHSAQRRGAVRDVIITAVADNGAPQADCARALDILGSTGKQVTRDSLTALLGKMNTRPGPSLLKDKPGTEPAPTPRRRTCGVHGHETTELTESGLCPACAADSRARVWSPPQPQYETPSPPTLGAQLLDHGAEHLVEISDSQARNQLVVERAYLNRLPDRDAWLQAGYDALQEDGYEPHVEAVVLVAAELHRRALADRNHTHPSEGTPR